MDHAEAIDEHVETALLDGLGENSLANGFDPNYSSFQIALRDDDDNILGGVQGDTLFNWLNVKYLWVDKSLRGQDYGTKLMRAAEHEAITRGCIGMMLNTMSFQARGFYEKLGFKVFGTQEGYPAGGACYYMRKDF